MNPKTLPEYLELVHGIAWTHATYNPWVGCSGRSPGCLNCYAEMLALRFGVATWGPNAQRVRKSRAYLDRPLKWQAKCERAGKRMRVFCASMADVFDSAAPDEWREDLFAMIAKTPMIDWQLLTKRIELVDRWSPVIAKLPNCWIGTSVEDQHRADSRLPILAKIPAAVRFISAEPLLEEVDLSRHLSAVDWVIVGGESGPRFRPMDPDWVRQIRDDCAEADVAFFYKQFSGRNPHGLGRRLDGVEHSAFPTPRRS